MNPLLRTATGWGRLPSWAYAGDAGKLAKMVGPVLVSPSWKNAPAGTTLIVKDTPAAGELFSLKPYEGTLVGLNALTADSAAVKQVLASLPRPIDVSEGARTLRVTLRTPDGATATQTADFYHPTPMRLTLLSPRDNQLTVRVENVNGAVFQGELRAEANGKTCVEDVSFAEGETTRTITMTELTKADMPYGFKLAVSPLPGGASGSTASELASATILMTALADPVSGEYSAKVESDDRNPGQVSVTVGSAPSSPDFSAAALTIDYWIATGRKAVILQAPASITSVVCPGTPSSLGMWVYGDGSKNILRTRFIDETDQVFQATYGAMTWTGWKYIQFPLNGTNARWWGGSNDGRVRGSIRILAPLIIDSQRSLATHATVYVGGMTLISTTP
jgi:hypothetical protein